MRKAKHAGIGIVVGVAIGTTIGVATDKLGLWICLGIAIGTGLGIAFMKEKKEGDDNSTKSS